MGGSVKRLQANGMKPTIIEDSESDEDAIVKAREDVEDNLQNEKIMKSMPEPLALGAQESKDNEEDEEEDDEDDDDDDDDDDVAAPPPEGMYDPSEYEDLNVGPDVKELFSDILRYTPQAIELDTRFKPFIPEFIPA